MKKNIVVGLDLGTTKVCAVIAEKTETSLKVLGFGVSPSDSLNKGLVANIAKTSQAISDALEVAQNRAGIEVKELNVGVAGEHITSLRHRNFVTISGDDDEMYRSTQGMTLRFCLTCPKNKCVCKCKIPLARNIGMH